MQELPSEINQTFSEINNSIHLVETAKDVINQSIDAISKTMIHIKEIDLSIKKMELQVELITKEYDFRIEKNKQISHIIMKQLNNYSNSMDLMLENILKMDSSSNDINYINHRSELIALLKNTSNNISSMFLHFISI